MLTPSRLVLALRPHASPALLVASASVAFHFAATPFLLTPVARAWGVTIGAAGLLSVTQVGGFTLANFVAGRRLRASRKWLVGAALTGFGANAASVLAPSFELLLATRVLAGLAAGLITWLAWTEAMRSGEGLRDIAAVGPLSALIGSPLVAWLVWAGDERIVFSVMALSCLPALWLAPRYEPTIRPGRRRMSPSRSNIVLLTALGLLTAAGSSLFVFAGAIGETRLDLAPTLVAFAFSANAAAGLVAARLSSRRAWPWMLVIAGCAVTVAFSTFAPAWFAAMTLWGFAFWMAVPVVLRQIAAWSLVPEERTGDAQGIMALGRVAGPAIGGALLGGGGTTLVGVEAGVGLALAALTVAVVTRYRSEHPERRPLDPKRTADA